MSEPYSVRVTVRGYETDVQGHLNQAVYLNYAEHARWSLLQAAGITQARLVGRGVGPVALETTIRYRHEVDVTCGFEWSGGKTFRMLQSITRADGTLAAEVDAVGGLLDLKARRLVADPGEVFKELTSAPDLFGF
ncbi:acyl-CoA thioesterase [Streptomyces sp. NPDC096040]|uniref:acyl-CoA thioesterase n=1 Tax=Streptomyces sp. NPDC096040 TaxID=3155541 RepID=UPI00332B7D98